jgi:hypothetical protein
MSTGFLPYPQMDPTEAAHRRSLELFEFGQSRSGTCEHPGHMSATHSSMSARAYPFLRSFQLRQYEFKKRSVKKSYGARIKLLNRTYVLLYYIQ